MAFQAKETWLILQKELTHCYRDPHVLIYSLALPLLFYPLMVICLFEGGLWYAGRIEHQPVRVAAKELSAPLKAALQNSKHIELMQSSMSEPQMDLADGKVDAVISRSQSDSSIRIWLNESYDRSRLSKRKLQTFFSDFRKDTLLADCKAKGLDENFIAIFDVKPQNIVPLTDVLCPLLVALLGFSLLMVAMGAMYPAICVFAEEREKKTLDTTFLLPVSRLALVCGKFCCVVVVSLAAGVLNFVSMMMVFFLIFTQIQMKGADDPLGTLSFLTPLAVLEVAVTFVLGTMQIAAVFMLVTVFTRSFKEAQNVLTMPILVIMLLPLCCIIPGFELSYATSLIPILNIGLAIKGLIHCTASEGPLFCVWATTFAGAWAILWSIAQVVTSEMFVLGPNLDWFRRIGKQRS